MNQQMWAHPATQANIALLRGRGVQVCGPGSGDQACGEVGPGRLLEPAALVALLADSIRASALLAGVRVLITAGPTFEDIDPVRFIGNRSRSEEHTSELQSLMSNSYADFCLKKKHNKNTHTLNRST